jgi:hypothetical protein
VLHFFYSFFLSGRIEGKTKERDCEILRENPRDQRSEIRERERERGSLRE